MTVLQINGRSCARKRQHILFPVLSLFVLLFAAAAPAQPLPERVEGVENIGNLTAVGTDRLAADDDHDDKEKSKSKKKKVSSEAKKDDQKTTAKATPDIAAAVSKPSRTSASGEAGSVKKVASSKPSSGLSAEANYISVAEAVKIAKASGGKGEVLKIDLEWDLARSLTTWDVTFSSGTEYEIDAASGKLLGSKTKAPSKLAALTPLALEGRSVKGGLSFQQIIRKAEARHKQTVMEMELKGIKGRSGTLFEVVLADGKTLFYDAATGGETQSGA